jgi:hypothetical protein
VTRAEEFEELRPLLFSITYRILGSMSEAEDAVQEALSMVVSLQGDLKRRRWPVVRTSNASSSAADGRMRNNGWTLAKNAGEVSRA